MHSALAFADRVALEVLWVGTLAVPVGALAEGAEMRAHFGVFLTFREGRIVRQHNYDWFEPFSAPSRHSGSSQAWHRRVRLVECGGTPGINEGDASEVLSWKSLAEVNERHG